MRAPNLGTVQFSVGNPGDIKSLEELTRYVREVEQRIASSITLLASGHLDEIAVAPLKPRNGDLALADGTLWNPGSGRGVYWFDGNALTWNFLG